jgi:hypothetical protein
MPLVTLVVESKLSYEMYFSEGLYGMGSAFILICLLRPLRTLLMVGIINF